MTTSLERESQRHIRIPDMSIRQCLQGPFVASFESKKIVVFPSDLRRCARRRCIFPTAIVVLFRGA